MARTPLSMQGIEKSVGTTDGTGQILASINYFAGSTGAFVSGLPFAIVKTGNPLHATAPLPYVVTILIGIGIGVTSFVGRRLIRTL